MTDTPTADLRRLFVRELQTLEVTLMRYAVAHPTWLAKHDEAALRWALSLARLSTVVVQTETGTDEVEIGRSSDEYRKKLHDSLAPCVSGEQVARDAIQNQIEHIRTLARDERDELLRLFGGRLPMAALDKATRRRPLAMAMSGGGGTAYIFVGAMQAVEDAGLRPDLVAATSMGAVLSAFRCRTKDFELKQLKALMTRLSWRRVFRLFETNSRFGLPATLKLYLREVIGNEFLRDGEFLRLKDLEIPLRVCVAGITGGAGPEDVDKYAHLLDDAVIDARRFRRRGASIARALSEVTKLPLKPIYLGGDPLTEEFDVLDACGFSSAVPGVIHYDILRDDPRMVEVCERLLEREGCVRLVDGGVADNLPAREAWSAVQGGAIKKRDPFVVAFDSFAPRLGRHMLFLPLMRIAAENSKQGRQTAHLTVTFKNVLSPLSVVPSQNEFLRAINNGAEEVSAHIPLMRKMVGPIPDPPGIVTERDGT